MAKKIALVKLIVVCVLGVALIAYLAVKTIAGIKSMQAAVDKDLPFTYTMPLGDSSIIRAKYLNKLKVEHIVNFKGRKPISVYKYDDNYHLIITKVDLAKGIPLNEILNFSLKCADLTVGEVYTPVTLNEYSKFEFQSKPEQPVANIFLKMQAIRLADPVNPGGADPSTIIPSNSNIAHPDAVGASAPLAPGSLPANVKPTGNGPDAGTSNVTDSNGNYIPQAVRKI